MRAAAGSIPTGIPTPGLPGFFDRLAPSAWMSALATPNRGSHPAPHVTRNNSLETFPAAFTTISFARGLLGPHSRTAQPTRVGRWTMS